MIVAETSRLILRQHTPESADLLYPIMSDPVTMSFYPEPFTREKVEAWVHRSLDLYRERGFGRYAVYRKPHEEFIGCVGFFSTEVNGKPEIDLGYTIDRKYAGMGYATEAAQACLDLARKERWFNRVVIQMAAEHKASRRVAEHLGVTLETQFYNPRNRGKLTNLFVRNILDE